MGFLEIGLIVLVIVIIFGARKLPELGKGLGQGIKAFKQETSETKSPTITVQRDDHTPRR